MNKAILIGRLTKDPEIRYTQSGKAVAGFTRVKSFERYSNDSARLVWMENESGGCVC